VRIKKNKWKKKRIISMSSKMGFQKFLSGKENKCYKENILIFWKVLLLRKEFQFFIF